MTTVLKWAGILLAFMILYHWFVGGQQGIIEGPPEILDEHGTCVEYCN